MFSAAATAHVRRYRRRLDSQTVNVHHNETSCSVLRCLGQRGEEVIEPAAYVMGDVNLFVQNLNFIKNFTRDIKEKEKFPHPWLRGARGRKRVYGESQLPVLVRII